MARSTARRAQAPHFEVNIFTDDAHRLSPKFVDNVLVVSGAAPVAEYVAMVAAVLRRFERDGVAG
ncbi:hypothetical protein F518_18343 [Serratia marcescens VGH107]|nr:hypothetical protein F518_18343 [Serratia marcescens VGH107]